MQKTSENIYKKVATSFSKERINHAKKRFEHTYKGRYYVIWPISV